MLVQNRRVGAVGGDRPLQAPAAQPLEADTGEIGRQRRDLVHRVGGRLQRDLMAERARHQLDDVEVGLGRAGRLDRRRDQLDPALGVGERAGLLQEGRRGQDHVGELGRLVLEDLLDDQEVERLHRGQHVLGVGIGLGDVLAEDVHRLQPAVDGGVEHLRDGVALVAGEIHAPGLLERPGDILVTD